MSKIIKPPWNLKGFGFITLYKFDNSFLVEKNLIPKFLKNKKTKGLGAIMLVNYENTPIGSYHELLFIPSKFSFPNRNLATISKIYVSTEESVNCGIKNWGIPKELANFNFTKIDKKRTKVEVTKDSIQIASFTFKETIIPIPVSTNIMKFPLIQKKNDNLYITNFEGFGKGKMAIIEEQNINDKFFPNVSNQTPLITIKVDKFNIKFPKPEVLKDV